MKKLQCLSLLLAILSTGVRAQWVGQKSGTTTELTDVAALDSVTAVAVGRDGSILKTTDAGQTWVNLPLMPLFFHPWNAASFTSVSCGVAAGDFGRVATTTDGGDHWSWRGVPGGGRLLSVLQISPSSIYAGDDSGWVYHSLDSGQTWSSDRLSTSPIRSIFPWTGGFVGSLPLYALTPYSLFSGADFPGVQWKETILSSFLGLGSEAFKGVFVPGGEAGFIVGVWGDFRAAPAIVRRTFPDSTWQSVAAALQGDGALHGIAAPSSDVIYVCGDGGMLFRSSNAGASWSTMTVPTTLRLNAVSFFDTLRGYAVGDSGTLLYTSNGGTLWAGRGTIPLPASHCLLQNYPNPFNPTTVVRYQLSAVSDVKLVVYDLLGREVALLVRERENAGSYEVKFDATGLASGVYFYTLEFGRFTSTRAMVLLK